MVGARLRNAALGSPLTKDTTVVAFWSQGTDFLKIIKKKLFSYLGRCLRSAGEHVLCFLGHASSCIDSDKLCLGHT